MENVKPHYKFTYTHINIGNSFPGFISNKTVGLRYVYQVT